MYMVTGFFVGLFFILIIDILLGERLNIFLLFFFRVCVRKFWYIILLWMMKVEFLFWVFLVKLVKILFIEFMILVLNGYVSFISRWYRSNIFFVKWVEGLFGECNSVLIEVFFNMFIIFFVILVFFFMFVGVWIKMRVFFFLIGVFGVWLKIFSLIFCFVFGLKDLLMINLFIV